MVTTVATATVNGLPAGRPTTASRVNDKHLPDVASAHPDYGLRYPEWCVMRDCARGPTAVDIREEQYLPMPSGFRVTADGGIEMYQAYKRRAQFPDIVSPTIGGMRGVVHRVPSQIDLPPGLEYLREDADGAGTPLDVFHRRVTGELLTAGRVELLVDAPTADAGGGPPTLALYVAESLINWDDDGESFFVLSEASMERDKFTWRQKNGWRVLQLRDGVYVMTVYGDDGSPVADREEVAVTVRGGGPMTTIPLVVINAADLGVDTETPPLYGVARSALAIYRLDADYRHQLFLSGQETLCITGVNEKDMPRAIGPAVVLRLPKDGMASYVSPSCSGIEAHERAIAAERATAAQLGARVFDDPTKAGVESADALKIRRTSGTATLVDIAKSSAAGLERSLRNAAVMVGEDPEAVIVKPNLSFTDSVMSPADALALTQVWQGGAISYMTLYENLQRGEIAGQERDADDERELIDQEQPPPAPQPKSGGASPGDGGGQDGGQQAQDDEPDASDDDVDSMFDPSLTTESD